MAPRRRLRRRVGDSDLIVSMLTREHVTVALTGTAATSCLPVTSLRRCPQPSGYRSRCGRLSRGRFHPAVQRHGRGLLARVKRFAQAVDASLLHHMTCWSGCSRRRRRALQSRMPLIAEAHRSARVPRAGPAAMIALTTLPDAVRELPLVPARRSARENGPVQHGELARDAVALSRSRADRIRGDPAGRP